MRLVLNRETALAVLRSIRCGKCEDLDVAFSGLRRCDLSAPELDEGSKWTARRLDLSRFPGVAPATKRRPVFVAVPSREARIQSKLVRNTCYLRQLPEGSFVDLGDGIAISSPELLFVEMSKLMDPAALALLGIELCGSFSRDSADPRTGDVVLGVEPVTSVEKIAEYLKRYGKKNSAPAARAALPVIANNAWSPMEAVVAALMSLPTTEYGYGIGELVLNKRVETQWRVPSALSSESRVPDILIAGTSVGLNYDGQEHLNLDGLAKLAAATVDGLVDEGDLALAKRAIRDKIHDDLLRNRELAASGLLVLPVTSEDLFRPGATDALMSVVCDLVEQRDGRDMTLTRKAIDSQALRRRRQLRVWSILPWSSAEDYSRELLRQERESASGGHAGDVVTLGADYFDLL